MTAQHERDKPSLMTQVWPTIERFLVEHGAAVLVTLAEAHGSTPREVGARMMVRPDGRFSGTIGGGALEWLALAEAQQMMAQETSPGRQGHDQVPSDEPGRDSFRRLSKALGPELGQCCGGRVVVTFERFDRDNLAKVALFAAAERSGSLVTIAEPGRPASRTRTDRAAIDAPYAKLPDGRIAERFGTDATPLYLFGAGHVGRSLALALAPLPFAINWIDPRPGAFPSHVPANAVCRMEAEPVRLLDDAQNDAFVAIMTHSHALDLDITAAALRARRFGYVGLIGSATKRARFASRLRQIGLPDDDIGRLICPIGLMDIKDKAPAAIAIGIAAQLLVARGAIGAAAAARPPASTEASHA